MKYAVKRLNCPENKKAPLWKGLLVDLVKFLTRDTGNIFFNLFDLVNDLRSGRF